MEQCPTKKCNSPLKPLFPKPCPGKAKPESPCKAKPESPCKAKPEPPKQCKASPTSPCKARPLSLGNSSVSKQSMIMPVRHVASDRQVMIDFVRGFIVNYNEPSPASVDRFLRVIEKGVADGIIGDTLYQNFKFKADEFNMLYQQLINLEYRIRDSDLPPADFGAELSSIVKGLEIRYEAMSQYTEQFENYYEDSYNFCSTYDENSCTTPCAYKDNKCYYPHTQETYNQYWKQQFANQ
jgi:hypothetical protein